MRRIATYLFLCAVTVLIVGCKSNEAGSSSYVGGADPYQATTDAATYEPTYEPTTYPVYTQPVALEAAYAPPEVVVDQSMPMDSTMARYHTVSKRDTLYGIARTYYGDHRRWKDIYEANRGDIGDPNRIRIGQRLLIP